MDNPQYKMEELEKISKDVRYAAYEIIEAKGATYYGIGMAICRIVRAILQDENSILTITSKMGEAYGLGDVYVGNPCIINSKGADRIIELTMTDSEIKKFKDSCKLLDDTFNSLNF